MSNALIALIIGFVFVLVVLPILVGIILAALDAIFRVDIGWGKLVWLTIILLVPVAGMLVYWLFRPRDYNPLAEEGPMEPSLVLAPSLERSSLSVSTTDIRPNAPTPQDGRLAAQAPLEPAVDSAAEAATSGEKAA
jgi:hypothetical protein